MFSKNKSESQEPAVGTKPSSPPSSPAPAAGGDKSAAPAAAPKAKPTPSTLSSDLTITGHIKTSGDIQIEGSVDGDIHAHMLTVGENATVKGEIIADDVVVTGRVVGRVRGIKVRLTSSARVEGDIVHKTIAIESGAHFEGSVQREDDPLKADAGPKKVAQASSN